MKTRVETASVNHEKWGFGYGSKPWYPRYSKIAGE
jgi:cation transport regulator ChaC